LTGYRFGCQRRHKRFALPARAAIVAPRPVKIEAVSKVSGWQKAGVVARVAHQQAGKSRVFNAITGAARATGRSFAHALHQLWLEVIGSLFLAMAAFGLIALVREYTMYASGRTTASHVAMAGCFTLAFGWFGVSSFFRVKKKGQRS
jgi:hypothetical protein